MSRRKLVIIGSALTVLAAACGGGGSADPIKIGIIADLTGPFTTYGTSLSRSAQLAINEINEDGGIDGRQIEVIVEDIQTDVTATVDKARKLVEGDNVDLVMGPIGSAANDAAYETVVVEGGKLLFYTETYEGGKCNELYFSFGAVPAQQIRPLIPILQDAYGPNAMLFGADYVWPRRSFEIAKPIIDEGGGTVVSELYLPLVADDFSELVQEVRDQQPDYIFSLYPAVWGAALKALDDAGLLDGVGVGTIFLGDPDYVGIADLAEGSYTALPFFTVADGAGVQPFLDAYGAEFGAGEVPSGGEGVGAYNAVYLYKAAVEAADSTDPAAVAEALVGLSFDGPTGRVTMASSHHLQQTINLVQAVNGQYTLVESFPDMDPEEDCSL
ncbi:MAG TPA: ABC transporter substrate-binding protein [Acidimicrobiia bacterium]|nr:ABC transporter substrate-binding protein [Acidimicrobiia bacterium]